MKRIRFASDQDVRHNMPAIVAHLRAGGLIAYPTETVYGFGGLIRDDALRDLTALKSRDPGKPFLLLVREAADVPQLEWTEPAQKLATTFWPGPLTLALSVREPFPAGILSADGTVAVRATPHDGVRALLRALHEPITSTSANTPGAPPAASAEEATVVLNVLGAASVLLLDGGTLAPSAPSTVVDCSGARPRVVRAGAITRDALAQVVEIE